MTNDQCQTRSPLHDALDWWALQDAVGGFAAAAASLFPGWTPRRSCRAPHREDRSPSFSLYRDRSGQWRFKDHATGEQGGLVAFVMLAGMDGRDAARWLMENSCGNQTGHRQRPVGMAVPSRPRRTHGPRMIAGDELPARFHGCGLLGTTELPPSPLGLSKSRVTGPSYAPYQMSASELNRSAAMADALLGQPRLLRAAAEARGWQSGTLRRLALDGSLGFHGGHFVMLYPTGAKKRFKPLDHEQAADCHGPKFIWLFGKPDSLWRGDRITAATTHIHITEGETDAITLIDAGCADDAGGQVVAVPGASCWRDAWAELFRGKRVTLWPDPDEPGQRLAARIAGSLTGVAVRIESASFHTV